MRAQKATLRISSVMSMILLMTGCFSLLLFFIADSFKIHQNFSMSGQGGLQAFRRGYFLLRDRFAVQYPVHKPGRGLHAAVIRFHHVQDLISG